VVTFFPDSAAIEHFWVEVVEKIKNKGSLDDQFKYTRFGKIKAKKMNKRDDRIVRLEIVKVRLEVFRYFRYVLGGRKRQLRPTVIASVYAYHRI